MGRLKRKQVKKVCHSCISFEGQTLIDVSKEIAGWIKDYGPDAKIEHDVWGYDGGHDMEIVAMFPESDAKLATRQRRHDKKLKDNEEWEQEQAMKEKELYKVLRDKYEGTG